MDYNFRVLAHLVGRTVVFQIHDVYYNDEDGSPEGYNMESAKLKTRDVKDFRLMLEKMYECLDKPILWSGDRFPEEFND